MKMYSPTRLKPRYRSYIPFRALHDEKLLIGITIIIQKNSRVILLNLGSYHKKEWFVYYVFFVK